jgi:Ohr subfamily peroxiredoxin
MDRIQPLFTATATASGGRNGRTESSDGIVKADLSVPKEMGGPGKPGTATPEHLFAAGYAACFGGAVDFVARQHKKDASKAKVTCAVSIGRRDGGGFALAVKLHVEDRSLPQGELETVAKEAHEKICPYSHCHARQRRCPAGREGRLRRGQGLPARAQGRAHALPIWR